jgi:2-polyprenyl-3-methyl-5-hydroxy-6-metoxy-1,4-benzoquinol methylase
MKRVPEKEVMDDDDNVVAYAHADRIFEEFFQDFVGEVIARYGPYCSRIIDLGCGTARIPIILAQRVASANIVGLDASATMLRVAEQEIGACRLGTRISLAQRRLPDIAGLEGRFDLILSDGMLHHLEDPRQLWTCVGALADRDCAVYIKDLVRPASERAARDIVERVAPGELPCFKRDFLNSLLAAYTVEEVEQQVEEAGLCLDVRIVSERHMVISGRRLASRWNVAA